VPFAEVGTSGSFIQDRGRFQLRRKFAVIKLWPNLMVAEDECIARLQITARSLGLECLVVDSFARLIDPPHTQLTSEDVDFVLNLHFETPQRYDIFSFVALWNPLQFFHDWGYRSYTRNLLTHDDFLSCSSPWADDQVDRLLADDPGREPPEFKLYHSLSEPILAPGSGARKLFYAGINWERISNRPQRHGALLKLLDESGDLRIYGPKRFQGVNVWAGYRSYKGPIPFDGVSVVRLIHEAGVSLVLSSEAHQQSELMSNRLFESLAAGAVVICDENLFARRFFGDTVLYIDTGRGAKEAFDQVQSHLAWIRSEPAQAAEMARQAQQIFLKDFSLDHCLRRLYRGLPERRQRLESLYAPRRTQQKITTIFLMPEFHSKLLEKHIGSCLAQRNVAIRPILAMDARDLGIFGDRVRARLQSLPLEIAVEPLEFFDRSVSGKSKSRRRCGNIIYQAIRNLVEDEYFCIVSPHEQLFSDHLCSLLRVLEDEPEIGSAWAGMLLAHSVEGKEHAELSGDPGIQSVTVGRHAGSGRFLFRRSALAATLGVVLPYLDALPADLLFGMTRSMPSKRCSLVMEIQDRYHVEITSKSRLSEERDLIADYAPSLLNQERCMGFGAELFGPIVASMTPEGKTTLAVQLAHSVPFPRFLEKIGYGIYRLWLKRCNARKHTISEK
jgi:hypothetical protein